MNDADRQRRFDALARRYSDDLYRFAVWLCRDPTLANDLIQETYLRAWKALDRLQDPNAAKSWLITILRREYARTFERKVPPLTDIDGMVVEDDKSLTPDDRLEREQLREAMLRMDEKYREPLILQTVLGLSVAEIAAELDLSESAVMTRVFRAREKLKQKLQDQSDESASNTSNVHRLS